MTYHKTDFLLGLVKWSIDHAERHITSYMPQNNSVDRKLASPQNTIKEAKFIWVCMWEVSLQ